MVWDGEVHPGRRRTASHRPCVLVRSWQMYHPVEGSAPGVRVPSLVRDRLVVEVPSLTLPCIPRYFHMMAEGRRMFWMYLSCERNPLGIP